MRGRRPWRSAPSHAFELDSLRKPGAGVHPGATVALPALAVAQAQGRSGRDLLTAITAGCEIMFRIGAATLHSAEGRGIHAPGITGVFGSAASAAVLMRLPAATIAHSFGICGSLTGGILAFAASGSGGMVKRLHLGRAAEGGVLAARLAAGGFEGPTTAIEGRYGVLDAYCEASDTALLTAGLGLDYEIARLCLKRYPCHVAAHAPVQLMRGWIEEHGFDGSDIGELRLEVTPKVMSHHGQRQPADLMLAQYSVPFVTAAAAFHDLSDPRLFDDSLLRDGRIRDLAGRIDMRESARRRKGWGVDMAIGLHDGTFLEGQLETFRGCPEDPFSIDELRGKFDRLAMGAGADLRASLFDALMAIDQLENLRDLRLA